VDKNDIFREWKEQEGKELNTMILSSIVRKLFQSINFLVKIERLKISNKENSKKVNGCQSTNCCSQIEYREKTNRKSLRRN